MGTERAYLLELERLGRIFINCKTDGEVEDFKKQIKYTLKSLDDARDYAARVRAEKKKEKKENGNRQWQRK